MIIIILIILLSRQHLNLPAGWKMNNYNLNELRLLKKCSHNFPTAKVPSSFERGMERRSQFKADRTLILMDEALVVDKSK